MQAHVDAPVIVEELTRDEGLAMINGLTRDRLGISAEEFLTRLKAGEYDGSEDELIFKLQMLVPFVQ